MSQLTYALKSLPSMTTQRCDSAAAVVNGKICAVGGSGGFGGNGRYSIELYDVVSGGPWTKAPSKMSRGRVNCAAAAIGNSVYVAGGHGDGETLCSMVAFDVGSGLWRTLLPMSTKRSGCTGVAVGNEFFVIGGMDASGETLNTAQSFNVETGRWGDLPPFNYGRHGCAAAAIKNKIYVVGGFDYGTNSMLNTVEVFDMATRTWALLPHRMTTSRRGCAAAAVGNYLIVAGGRDGFSKLNTVELYDVNTETWMVLPPMSTKRFGCAAVSLGGSVFVMGGQNENWRNLDSVEEITFSDDFIKGMLVEWSGGSWSNDILPLLHRRTSIVHKLDIDISSMPTLLSRVGEESKVQKVYEILRGEMGVFEFT